VRGNGGDANQKSSLGGAERTEHTEQGTGSRPSVAQGCRHWWSDGRALTPDAEPLEDMMIHRGRTGGAGQDHFSMMLLFMHAA